MVRAASSTGPVRSQAAVPSKHRQHVSHERETLPQNSTAAGTHGGRNSLSDKTSLLLWNWDIWKQNNEEGYKALFLFHKKLTAGWRKSSYQLLMRTFGMSLNMRVTFSELPRQRHLWCQERPGPPGLQHSGGRERALEWNDRISRPAPAACWLYDLEQGHLTPVHPSHLAQQRRSYHSPCCRAAWAQILSDRSGRGDEHFPPCHYRFLFPKIMLSWVKKDSLWHAYSSDVFWLHIHMGYFFLDFSRKDHALLQKSNSAPNSMSLYWKLPTSSDFFLRPWDIKDFSFVTIHSWALLTSPKRQARPEGKGLQQQMWGVSQVHLLPASCGHWDQHSHLGALIPGSNRRGLTDGPSGDPRVYMCSHALWPRDVHPSLTHFVNT